MTAQPKESCQTCRFCTTFATYVTRTLMHQALFHCRRYPPSPDWPEMQLQDWCGEYCPRDDKHPGILRYGFSGYNVYDGETLIATAKTSFLAYTITEALNRVGPNGIPEETT